jgi:lipid-A-disaccharide synthase
MDKKVVSELIQASCNSKSIKKELTKILDSQNRKNLISEYQKLEQMLGGAGASVRTAKLIIHNMALKS